MFSSFYHFPHFYCDRSFRKWLWIRNEPPHAVTLIVGLIVAAISFFFTAWEVAVGTGEWGGGGSLHGTVKQNEAAKQKSNLPSAKRRKKQKKKQTS